MGTAISNLVIVKGSKKEVAKFKKRAFLNESKAFCFEQLLPVPKHILAKTSKMNGGMSKEEYKWRMSNYGNSWGDGFSVIFKETPEEIHYYFNSKDRQADIYHLAELSYLIDRDDKHYDDLMKEKYNDDYERYLSNEVYSEKDIAFVHVFYNYNAEHGTFYDIRTYDVSEYIYYPGNINYQPGNSGTYEEIFSLNLETMVDTPAQMEEIYFKINLLEDIEKGIMSNLSNATFNYEHSEYGHAKNILQKNCFTDYYPQQQFLMKNAHLYNDLFDLEKKLWAKELKYAKEIGYPLRINSEYQIIKFKFNIEPSENKKLKIIKDLLSEIEQNDIPLVTNEFRSLLNYFYNLGYKKEIIDFFDRYLDYCITKINDFLAKLKMTDYVGLCNEYDEIIAYPEEYHKLNFNRFVEEYIMGQGYSNTAGRMASNGKIDEYVEKWEEVPDYLKSISDNDASDYRNKFEKLHKEAENTSNYKKLKKFIIQRKSYENGVLAKLELCRKKHKPEGTIFACKVFFNANDNYGISILKNGELGKGYNLPDDDDLPC